MKPTAAKILILLLVTLFSALVYTFLHESGHALVGLLAGGRISAFSVNFWQLSAHVGMDASLTPAQSALNNVAGASLPLMVWLVFMLVMPRRNDFVSGTLKISATLMFLSTLLVWIALPVLDIFGQAPASDDVIHFLRNSGVPPLWVAFFALSLLGGGIWLAARRLGGLTSIIENLQRIDANPSETRAALLALLGISLVIGLSAFALNGFRFSAPAAAAPGPPANARLLQKADLSETAHNQSSVCSFTLSESARVGIYLVVENINTAYVDVRLSGPAGYEQIILHGEGYSAALDYPRLETSLPPGRYTCLLTSKPSPGTISVYAAGLP